MGAGAHFSKCSFW
jgi:hypothetical protein